MIVSIENINQIIRIIGRKKLNYPISFLLLQKRFVIGVNFKLTLI